MVLLCGVAKVTQGKAFSKRHDCWSFSPANQKSNNGAKFGNVLHCMVSSLHFEVAQGILGMFLLFLIAEKAGECPFEFFPN